MPPPLRDNPEGSVGRATRKQVVLRRLIGRPEGDPKRLVEIFREDANLRLSSPLRGAENANSARSAFCDEKIAAWRNPDQARVVETCGQELRIRALSRARTRVNS